MTRISPSTNLGSDIIQEYPWERAGQARPVAMMLAKQKKKARRIRLDV
jgi:hypothetical protein